LEMISNFQQTPGYTTHKVARGAPKGCHRCTKMAKGTPKDGQKGPEGSSGAPQKESKGAQSRPRGGHMRPKDTQRKPKEAKGKRYILYITKKLLISRPSGRYLIIYEMVAKHVYVCRPMSVLLQYILNTSWYEPRILWLAGRLGSQLTSRGMAKGVKPAQNLACIGLTSCTQAAWLGCGPCCPAGWLGGWGGGSSTKVCPPNVQYTRP